MWLTQGWPLGYKEPARWARIATPRLRLPPSPLEQRERLEQLRALEAGMRIDAAVVDAVPISVDTPDDLARARKALGHR